jgi:hypothetical protein
MKNNLFFLLLLSAVSLISISAIFSEDQVKGPKNPKDPALDQKKDMTKETAYNVEFQNQKGEFGKGAIIIKSGIKFSLITKENENREILLDSVKSIRIKGYAMKKKTEANLSAVYYMPYMYDLALNDGSILQDLKGSISELELLNIESKLGKKKFYTYFMRWWLEDKKIFNDNKSANYYEKAKVPDAVVIYLEFK